MEIKLKEVEKMRKMNKKGFLFAMMHPGMMFLFGVIIGAVLIYFLVAKGILPTNLLPF
ncbi:MAG: hypothetical protein AABX34_04025 [Nanoarchaeota archaeon]